MKVKELIDLGFHINFVSAEEGGGKPYFYVGFAIGDMYLMSEAVVMKFKENKKKCYEKYLDNEVKIVIFDHETPLSEETIRSLVEQKL